LSFEDIAVLFLGIIRFCIGISASQKFENSKGLWGSLLKRDKTSKKIQKINSFRGACKSRFFEPGFLCFLTPF
jgi:hypothetical protein